MAQVIYNQTVDMPQTIDAKPEFSPQWGQVTVYSGARK